MDIRKILILVFSILFFTACTVDYNIELNDEIFDENLTIYESDSTKFSSDIYGNKYGGTITLEQKFRNLNDLPQSVLTNQPIDIYNPKNELDGTIYYEKTLTETDNLRSIEFKTNVNLTDLRYLNSVKQCYDDFNVSVSTDRLSISTSEINKCFENYSLLDKININLNINFKEEFEVIENNATISDGNKYTWVIDKNNYKNQSIKIVVDRTPDNNKKENVSIILLIICGIVLAIGGIIYLFFGIRNKRINKI